MPALKNMVVNNHYSTALEYVGVVKVRGQFHPQFSFSRSLYSLKHVSLHLHQSTRRMAR